MHALNGFEKSFYLFPPKQLLFAQWVYTSRTCETNRFKNSVGVSLLIKHCMIKALIVQTHFQTNLSRLASHIGSANAEHSKRHVSEPSLTVTKLLSHIRKECLPFHPLLDFCIPLFLERDAWPPAWSPSIYIFIFITSCLPAPIPHTFPARGTPKTHTESTQVCKRNSERTSVTEMTIRNQSKPTAVTCLLLTTLGSSFSFAPFQG